MVPLRRALLIALFSMVSPLALGTAHAQVAVQLPAVAEPPGATVDLAVTIAPAPDGDEVTAYALTVTYDAALLTITGARNSGTLTDGWPLTTDTATPGAVSVSSESPTGLSGGSGTLVVLEAELPADASGAAALQVDALSLNGGSVPFVASSGTVSTGTLPPDRDLVINEINADPATSTECAALGAPALCGDANGDGTRSATADEFIEIVNAGGSPIPLDAYTIADESGVRFTFPPGTALPPGTAAVVFGGGTPVNIPGRVFVASSLGLNNGGDAVTLRDGAGQVVAAVQYSDDAIERTSATRSPDLDGLFTAHRAVAPDGALSSPGRTLDGGTLPVELRAFDAVRDGRDAVLRWTTASETNNSGFSVQHRRAGAFREVAFVDGAGTTRQAQQYSYRVRALAAGTHTFRLAQIDADGTVTPSPSVELSIPIAEPFTLTPAHPNPFRSTARLVLTVRETQAVSVTLYNLLGQRVRQLFRGTVQANAPQPLSLDGRSLPSGVYVYRVQGRTFSTTRQAVLVR